MFRRLFIIVLTLGPVSAPIDGLAATPERLPLWSGPAPVGDGSTEQSDAWLTVHRAESPSGTAMVICPGGGYGGLVTGPEGHGIARWLNRHGITGLVLEYRLPSGRPYVPLLDGQRAVRMARAHASDWGLKPDRIGIIGFSAGGHLAASVATHFDAGITQSRDPVTRHSSRPDFAILIYPVITMTAQTHPGSRRNLLGAEPADELIELFSCEKQVTRETPPVFLAHARDDRIVVPGNSQVFHDALKAHNVPTRYLELPSGGHGLNRYQGPMWDAWQEQSLAWLKSLRPEQ